MAIHWSCPDLRLLCTGAPTTQGSLASLLLLLCLQGLQECSRLESNTPGKAKDKGRRVTLQNQFLGPIPEITSPVPMEHLTSATGTKSMRSNSSTREQVTNQANEASLEHTTGGKMTQQENLIHCQIYHLSTCSNRAACCRESQEQAHSVLKPSGRVG